MPRQKGASESVFVDEVARLICDEGYASYPKARQKAAERLGMGRAARVIDNTRIERAVLERQQLFGGQTYLRELYRMRSQALRIMALLRSYEPRLAGSAVSGAIGQGHRIQIHVLAEQPEIVEMRLHDLHIAFEQDERRYRFADGREREIPLLGLEVDGGGADIAIFNLDDARNPPLSQVDGKPIRRLPPAQVQALLDGTENPSP